MAKRSLKKKSHSLLELVTNPDAAGIDIGATEIVVAVPADRAQPSIRTFGSTTPDLRELGAWLQQCGITTVAMESTGVYWLNPFKHLREVGIEVILVNAQQTKLCPARKTDVIDAQWLMLLHRSGLLTGSFHPPEAVAQLRDLMRERLLHVQAASQQLLRMQKVFISVNVQLHHALSDLDGVSGLRIIEAILAGEHSPRKLWSLRDPRCKTPEAEALKALEGKWTEQSIGQLRRYYQSWQHYRQHIQELDRLLEGCLKNLEAKVDQRIINSAKRPPHQAAEQATETQSTDQIPELPRTPPRGKKRRKGELSFDLLSEARRLYGIDLSTIPGVSTNILATLISEVGPADVMLENFRSSAAFCSWLGLCPDNRKSGGKVLRARTRRVNSRLAAALRMSAQTLWRSGAANAPSATGAAS